MRSKTLVTEQSLRSDPRLADHWIKMEWKSVEKQAAFSKSSKQIAILTYPDDEGVRHNNGRAGAAEGAERILHFLGRMVYRGKETPPILIISDALNAPYLEKRHEDAEKRLLHLLKLNCRVITLGGGHDYGF